MIEGGGGVESRLLPVKLLAAAATFSPFNQHPETSFSNSVERKALSLPSNAQIAKGPWCWYALLSLLQLRRLSPPVPWCQGILSPSPDRLWKWNFLPSWHRPCLCIVRGRLGDTLDKLNMVSLPKELKAQAVEILVGKNSNIVVDCQTNIFPHFLTKLISKVILVWQLFKINLILMNLNSIQFILSGVTDGTAVRGWWAVHLSRFNFFFFPLNFFCLFFLFSLFLWVFL